MTRQNHQHRINYQSKPRFRANGSALLPLALRPGLSSIFRNNKLFTITSKNLILLAVLSVSCFIFQNSYTNNVSAASITLTIPSESLSLNISDPSSNGGFDKSKSATISVKTDSSTGYTLSIKSKNSDSDISKSNDLTNTSNPSSKLTSILAAVSESDFSSSGLANTWGYLPSKLNSSDNSNFLPGPTSDASILEKTSTANSDAPNDYNITLATKVDSSTPSGNYANTFVLTVTSNQPIYDAIMQDWDGCEALEEHQTANLLDTRDNKIYMVSKLKDGKCWMVQNLALGDEQLENRTLTSEDSDVSSDFTLPASTTSGFTSGEYDTAWVYVDGTYGGYYSWKAATAGTGTGSMSSGNAASSICPKGWRLPTGGPSSELETMVNKYGSHVDTPAWTSALQASPVPNFVLSGRCYNSVMDEQGEHGSCWSSTARADVSAYHLSVAPTYVTFEGSSSKFAGFSVRCVARERNKYNIAYNLNSGSWDGISPQTGTTTDNIIKLDNAVPIKADYVFKGWCDQETSDEACSGTTYQPGEDYNILDDRKTATLYAMWKKETSCLKPITECSYGGYSGQRFGNGKCWMSTDYQTSTTRDSASCPSGWHLPTKEELESLASSEQAGNGGCLYEQGWSGYYWASTLFGCNNQIYCAYYDLHADSSRVFVSSNLYNSEFANVRCVSSQSIILPLIYEYKRVDCFIQSYNMGKTDRS